VIQVNGVPIFADIDPETYQIDPAAIRDLITKRTKAIVPVHYGGYPADMDEIMKIAEKNGLLVVEDCAEAHGSDRSIDLAKLGTLNILLYTFHCTCYVHHRYEAGKCQRFCCSL
jgi:dTDP-4-amino-4,6-dideoxygalactose transaminase